MWSPTHVQVTVLRARELLAKGKNGTNDVFTQITLGKNEFRTSVKQKALPANVDWNEQCQMEIPVDEGNRAKISVTLLHQNFIGVDEFLGRITLPLIDFDVYEPPKNRWYPLQSKIGHKHKVNRPRGHIEIKIAFTVQPEVSKGASLNGSKMAGSVGQLATRKAHSLGGSLLNVRSKSTSKRLETNGFLTKKSLMSKNLQAKQPSNHFDSLNEEVESKAAESDRRSVENPEVKDVSTNKIKGETDESIPTNKELHNCQIIIKEEPEGNNSPCAEQEFAGTEESVSINEELCQIVDIIKEEEPEGDSSPCAEQEFAETEESIPINEELFQIIEMIKEEPEGDKNPHVEQEFVETDESVPINEELHNCQITDIIKEDEEKDHKRARTHELTEINVVAPESSEMEVSQSHTNENEETQVDDIPIAIETSEIQVSNSEINGNEAGACFGEDPAASADPNSEDQTEEAGEGSVLSVSESVAESEREMKPRKEMFDSRVVIDETRVIYEKYSCENQHFKMNDVMEVTPTKVENEQKDYRHLSTEGLIEALLTRDQHILRLNEYIDNLSLRLLNVCPTLLNNPKLNCPMNR